MVGKAYVGNKRYEIFVDIRSNYSIHYRTSISPEVPEANESFVHRVQSSSRCIEANYTKGIMTEGLLGLS